MSDPRSDPGDPGDEASRDAAIRGLEHEIGRLLRRIRRGQGDRAARVHPDLSATAYPLLVMLAELGPHRASDLAEHFALDKGAVSRMVHHLTGLGLIERAPDPQDGRASILSVTPDAEKRLAVSFDQRHQVVEERLADWEASSIAELASGLARFNAAISVETT